MNSVDCPGAGNVDATTMRFDDDVVYHRKAQVPSPRRRENETRPEGYRPRYSKQPVGAILALQPCAFLR